jgi:hypothetical protein
MDTPMIWTCKGNLPIDSLTMQVRWTVSEDEICFEEFYYDASGEEVKHSAHKFLPKASLPIGAQQGSM